MNPETMLKAKRLLLKALENDSFSKYILGLEPYIVVTFVLGEISKSYISNVYALHYLNMIQPELNLEGKTNECLMKLVNEETDNIYVLASLMQFLYFAAYYEKMVKFL